MSVDKLVDSTQLDSDLTSVANAIRTKGGISASLAFPAGFVSAINAISGGGGGVELKSGTLTFATRTAWAGYTLDVGIDASQFAIYATTNPLQSNGRTFQGFFVDLATSYEKGGLWVSSNAAGSAASGSFISNSSNVSKSGTVLTFKGGSSDYFQAGITYQWYAWGAST